MTTDETTEAVARAVAAERARCAARVRDAYPTSALKSTPTLRAVAAALDAARRGIESGDMGADEPETT